MGKEEEEISQGTRIEDPRSQRAQQGLTGGEGAGESNREKIGTTIM